MTQPIDPAAEPLDPIVSLTREIPNDRDGRTFGDTIRIEGEFAPGLCIPKNAGSVFVWEKSKPYGMSGAVLRFVGKDLASFELHVLLWTETQLHEWFAFAKKYFYPEPLPVPLALGPSFPPSRQPKALGVSHPALVQIGIDAIVVDEVGQLEQGEDAMSGSWATVVKVTQWRPPSPALAKPTEKIPDAAKSLPTARTKAQEEILRLQKQARELEDDLARKQRQ